MKVAVMEEITLTVLDAVPPDTKTLKRVAVNRIHCDTL
jgi:hypothetical protein